MKILKMKELGPLELHIGLTQEVSSAGNFLGPIFSTLLPVLHDLHGGLSCFREPNCGI